jgi:hypothetical protein
MGFRVKFNWVLQHEIPEGLSVNNSYSFKKSGNRVFPIGTAIDLIDLDRNAIAKIKVITFLNDQSGTTGTFETIKLYAGTEKKVLSNYWKENE